MSELVALLAEQLDEGNSVLAVTHDAQFVRAIADIEVRLQPSDASIQTGPAVIRAVRRVGRA